MPAPDPQTADLLRRVVSACRLSHAACLNAREAETNEGLRDLYRQMAAERARFADEVVRLAAASWPEARRWASQSSEGDPVVAVREAGEVEAEREVLAVYEAALDAELPENLREALERQYEQIAAEKDEMTQLHDLRLDTRREADSDTPGTEEEDLDEEGRDADIRPDQVRRQERELTDTLKLEED
jgi:hypothetical protein